MNLNLADSNQFLSSFEKEYVQCFYLDPPFFTNREFVGFSEAGKVFSGFSDKNFEEYEIDHVGVLNFLKSFEEAPIYTYLTWMSKILVQCHRTLKETGTLYLHCDDNAVHYLKILCDVIFGYANFVSQITWKRSEGHNDSKQLARNTDYILVYAKCYDQRYFVRVEIDRKEESIKRYSHTDKRGAYCKDNIQSPSYSPTLVYEWKGFNPPKKGWRFCPETMERMDNENRIWYPTKEDGSFDYTKRPYVKRYLHEVKGKSLTTLWDDIEKEKWCGYPTEKPRMLLKRLFQLCTKEGDVVVDPFMGSGTSAIVAHEMKLDYYGCDMNPIAIEMTQKKLEGIPYTTNYNPSTIEAAKALALCDRYKFQCWVAEKLGAINGKKGKDGGIDCTKIIDGKKIAIQVKSGKVSSKDVQSLYGAMLQFGYDKGIFVTLEKPSVDMLKSANKLNIEILTIDKLV